MNGWDVFVRNTSMVVGNGRRVKFWEHILRGDVSLRDAFPNIYRLACDKEAKVQDYLLLRKGFCLGHSLAEGGT